MRMLSNIFWLGTKELRSVVHDVVLLALVAYSFSLAIISQSQLDFGRSTRRKRARFAYDARYGAEFRCCLGGAVT